MQFNRLALNINFPPSWPHIALSTKNTYINLFIVAGDRDAWRSQLELLPPQPQKNKRAKKNTLNRFNVFPENDNNDDDKLC